MSVTVFKHTKSLKLVTNQDHQEITKLTISTTNNHPRLVRTTSIATVPSQPKDTQSGQKTRGFKKQLKSITDQQLFQIKLSLNQNLPAFAEKLIDLPPNPLKKKTLILDLDRTLVFVSDQEENSANPEVSIRPFTSELLNYASRVFELIAFTSSNQLYSNKLIDLVDPKNRYFSSRLSRKDCVSTALGYVKDLRVLKNRSLKNIIIVDDSIFSFSFQLYNGVPIFPWTGEKEDSELKKLTDFLKLLEKSSDVRYNIKNTFGLTLD